MKLKFLILGFFAFSQLTQQSKLPPVTYQIQSPSSQQSSFGTSVSPIPQFQFDSTRSNTFNPSQYRVVSSSPQMKITNARPVTITSYTYSPQTSSYVPDYKLPSSPSPSSSSYATSSYASSSSSPSSSPSPFYPSSPSASSTSFSPSLSSYASSSSLIPQFQYPSQQEKQYSQILAPYTPDKPTKSFDFFNAPPRIEKVQLDPTLVSPQNQVYFSSNRGFNQYIADQAGYPIANEQRLRKEYPYLGSNVQGRITDPNIINLFGIKTPQALYQQSIVLPGKFVVYPDLNSGPSQSSSYGSNSNLYTTPQARMQNPNPTQLGGFGTAQYPSWVTSYYGSPSFGQNVYGLG